MRAEQAPTARQFCAALRSTGIEADLGPPFYAAGILLDGRTWLLTNTVNEGHGNPDEPLSALELWITGTPAENDQPLGRLLGCTAAEAEDALRRAEKGDYSAFTPVDASATAMAPPRGPRPLEGTLTRAGAPAFAIRDREYLRAVRSAVPEAIARWRSATCPECSQAAGPDGISFTPDGTAEHACLDGGVILGCEGYWVVNPAAAGLDPGNWQDWREQAALAVRAG